MIFERWTRTFDVAALRRQLQNEILHLEPVFQSPSFGGWSVLSSNGSYRDGWSQGHKVINGSMTSAEALQAVQAAGFKKETDYVVPTEICTGYLAEVIKFITDEGLRPSRARVIRLTAGMASSWHRDAPDHAYSVRLHIPILTNSNCFFETETDRAHLPDDGSAYFIQVNRLHRVINQGNSHRYHLVINVQDCLGITQFHQYDREQRGNL